MSNTNKEISKRYFQLTPNILVEYNYAAKTGTGGIDVVRNANVIENKYCSNRSFFKNEDSTKYVLPINMAESKFILCNNGTRFVWNQNTNFERIDIEPNSSDESKNKTPQDSFKLHFTSKNYFGDYDGLIISVNVYDVIKNKISLFSQIIRKTDDVNLNENPFIINQKLYTTSLNFTLPSISSISPLLKSALFPKHNVMENTPIIMNIYGIKSEYNNNTYTYYNVEKINSIYIPIEDKSDILTVHVDEASDGDYFEVYPIVNDGITSFSDYIYNISDGRPELYIVFYELSLIEHYTDANNQPQSRITHKEQYIINSARMDNDKSYQMNETELDVKMYYRPILLYAAHKNIYFTIDVKINIINTLDNTTIIKGGTLDYGNNDGKNPKKYGKKMNKIYLGEIPAQINVYNKKPDIDTDGIRLTNASSNVKIENHQHSVIGFIECANVGVSIEQVPKELLS